MLKDCFIGTADYSGGQANSRTRREDRADDTSAPADEEVKNVSAGRCVT